MDLFFDAAVLSQIMPAPGFIMQPLGFVFGHIIDFIMRGLSFIFTPVNALGFSIIVITLIVRGALIPQQVKMQKNSAKARAIKPEMDKIREKYGNTRDPEQRRKMAAETQALNQKHGINLMASCLPLLVTMPLFIALFGVFGRAFHFLPSINEVYTELSHALIAAPYWFHSEVLVGMITDVMSDSMLAGTGFAGYQNVADHSAAFYTANPVDLNRAIHVFTPENWTEIFNSLQNTVYYDAVRSAYDARMVIEDFFGLNLVTVSGWGWPGIIIPILAAGTMAISSWQMAKVNPATDAQTKMMQRIMIFALPLMFGWFTATAASAVGIYWAMGNIFLIVQNVIVFKYFPHKIGMGEKPQKRNA